MMSNLDRLVYMANQIARNFEALGNDAATLETADHIAHFWAPEMRRRIFAYIDGGGTALTPAASAALAYLRHHCAPPPQNRATEFNAADEAGHADAG